MNLFRIGSVLFPALVLIAACVGDSSRTQAAPPLQLRKGDHIAYIGNATADRMQHSAWLETYIHAMFPEYD